jgi:hypothetical protein
MVEEKRNILVGYVPSPITETPASRCSWMMCVLTSTHVHRSLGIFIGFAAFFIMEKTLRVLGGGEGHTHSHEGNEHPVKAPDTSTSSAVETHTSGSGMRSRHQVNDEHSDKRELRSEEVMINAGGPSKLSAYLNLFGDFVHNMCVVLRSLSSDTY